MSEPLPIAVETPVEARLARNMVARSIYLVPLAFALGGLLRGLNGAWAALIGLAVVAGNLYLSGKLLSLAIRVSLTMYHAAALIGFVLRMALIAGTMFMVVRFVEIDRVAFGVSAVVCYMVLVTLEAISVMRDRERNLDWAG
ncbi:MAG: hypothetical protein LC739_08295 [Actinobacteria bacterium]|nr:hypothetical protein [Actinomycetota bacterium]